MSWSYTLHCVYATSDLYHGLYTCRGSSPFSTNNFFDNGTVTELIGQHEAGKSVDNVQGLHILGDYMNIFPNVRSFFTNLKLFYFEADPLSTISNDNLIQFPNLEYLKFSRTGVASLDSNLFSGLKYLKVIDFSENKIVHVGHDLVLPKNSVINFKSNTCIDTSASTPEEITMLKLHLRVYCSPQMEAIQPIQTSLLNDLTEKSIQLEKRVASLEKVKYELNISHVRGKTLIRIEKKYLK